MTTAKLSGDKIRLHQLEALYAFFRDKSEAIETLLNDYSPDKELKDKVMRQINSADAIIAKELLKESRNYLKSIDKSMTSGY